MKKQITHELVENNDSTTTDFKSPQVQSNRRSFNEELFETIYELGYGFDKNGKTFERSTGEEEINLKYRDMQVFLHCAKNQKGYNDQVI